MPFNHSKVIAFHSPKTAGCTLVALNSAILYQATHIEQKVLLMQLTSYPDLELYIGTEAKNTLADFTSFQETEKEWTQSVFLSSIQKKYTVDVLFSPAGERAWGNISAGSLQMTLEMAKTIYDVIFIDIGRIDFAKVTTILPLCEKLISVMTLDPISLFHLKLFLGNVQTFISTEKTALIINQCTPGAEQWMQKWEKELSIPLLGTIPVDRETLWLNVFQHLPAASDPKSPFSMALRHITDRLT